MTTPGCIVRGTTVNFATTFYDASGNITQPEGAVVNLSFQESGQIQQTAINMTAPTGDATAWLAEWDTRGISPGQVAWSIHSVSSGIPFVVQDGSFSLVANNANLVTF